MTIEMENVLREEIEFVQSCLDYEDDLFLEPIQTLEEAQAQVQGYIKSVGIDEMPDALENPVTMLLVFNYCVEKEQEKRRKARIMGKVLHDTCQQAKDRKEYYQRMKRRARSEAIIFQRYFDEIMEACELSLFEWTAHFRKIGKRYGLIREFEENGII